MPTRNATPDLLELRNPAVQVALDAEQLVRALNAHDQDRAQQLAQAVAERSAALADALDAPAGDDRP